MPDGNEPSLRDLWIAYILKVELLMAPQADDRPLDQYLPLRDRVLAMVRSERFLGELQQAWAPSSSSELDREVAGVLLMELEAFPRAVEVAKATEEPGPGKRWRNRWLDRAATVSGSVTDLLDALPPYAKGALTLFKELVDLFKGKD